MQCEAEQHLISFKCLQFGKVTTKKKNKHYLEERERGRRQGGRDLEGSLGVGWGS